MATLETELTAYRTKAAELEASHPGKWVIFKETSLISIHDTLEAAAEDAVARFGHGPYLIRQIGAGPIVIPVSLAYNPDA
jgi:hypothetical protein